MPTQLKIDPGKCIGCKSCELACSLANDGAFNPAASRIAAITFLEGDYTLPYHFVSTCRQCADAPCMASCPAGAIHRSSDATKRIIIDKELCIGCGTCVKSCPFGAMFFDAVGRKAFKCELCNGNPACVAVCPTEAILYAKQHYYHAKEDDLKMRGYTFMARNNSQNIKKKVSKEG